MPELSELVSYRPRIVRFVRTTTGVPHEVAEDLAQQVLFELARTGHRFEGRSSLSTWVFGVARNVCRTHLRRREDATDPQGDAWRRLPDPARDPEALLAESQAKLAVRRALESLPVAYREVVVLREWEELSYDAIAAVLEVPVGTVRSRLHTARALLAERLLEALG